MIFDELKKIVIFLKDQGVYSPWLITGLHIPWLNLRRKQVQKAYRNYENESQWTSCPYDLPRMFQRKQKWYYAVLQVKNCHLSRHNSYLTKMIKPPYFFFLSQILNLLYLSELFPSYRIPHFSLLCRSMASDIRNVSQMLLFRFKLEQE